MLNYRRAGAVAGKASVAAVSWVRFTLASGMGPDTGQWTVSK
jgi:hypothetical protein